MGRPEDLVRRAGGAERADHLGPGRHGPGNNLFVMFDDPAANRIELSCEMERYWDELADYTPRQWHPGVKTINLWGVAPSWRKRVAP